MINSLFTFIYNRYIKEILSKNRDMLSTFDPGFFSGVDFKFKIIENIRFRISKDHNS